jgi:hypothetical protein
MRVPRFAEALLRGFISDPDLEEAILGDLAEEWGERAERAGSGPASAWYWGQVLRSVPHLLRHGWLRRSRRRAHDRPTDPDPPTLEEAMKDADPPIRLAARPLLAAAAVLAVPLVAMQFTDEVVWTLSDFVIMGVLVAGTGVLFELALTRTGSIAYRAASGVALAAAFLLVWVNLAVGVIGASGHPANLMYAGVLAVGIGGAVGAGLEPRGMARALAATAVAQVAVGAVALIAALGSPWHVIGATAMFAGLFAGSAWLFRTAARTRAPAGAAPAG